jgi:hypothetical protein
MSSHSNDSTRSCNMKWVNRERDESVSRWPRRIMFGAAGLGLFLFSLTLVLWWTWQSVLSRHLAEIRARGEPTTYVELDAYYARPPAGQDATDLLLRAGRVLRMSEATAETRKLPYVGEAADPPRPGQPWSDLDLARQFLVDNAEALHFAHEAAELGGRARFKIVVGQNAIALPFEHLQTLRAAVRALRLEADVRVHSGDIQAATASVCAGIVLSNALEKEPVLVSQLVRLGMFGSAAHELKQLLPVTAFSDSDLSRLQEQLQSIDFADGAKLAMLGSRVEGISIFDDPKSAGFTSWQVALSRPLLDGAEGVYLDVMDEYISAAVQPWPQMIAAMDELRREASSLQSPVHLITRQMLPSIDMTVSAFVRSELTRRLLIVAVALERYRRREGHPAAELAVLVPDYLTNVPDDPTSGDPFRYASTAVGYVLYSPYDRFSVPHEEELDPETGANPMLLFRWPPLPEKPRAREITVPAEESETDTPAEDSREERRATSSPCE